MKQYNHLLLLALAALVLTACGPLESAVNPYEEDFKCKASDETGKCLDTPSAYKESRYPQTTGGPSGPKQIPSSRYKMLAQLLEEEEKPVLQPPKILRVLLLPYKGEKEELFMTRFVYVKIEDSDWILSNINEKVEKKL